MIHTLCIIQILYWLATSGGRVPVVAVCVFHMELSICCTTVSAILYKETKTPSKKIDQFFSAWEAKDKQLYPPTCTLMPTSLYFRGMTTFQTHKIKCRNKHVRINISLSQKAINCNKSANKNISFIVYCRTRVTINCVCF